MSLKAGVYLYRRVIQLAKKIKDAEGNVVFKAPYEDNLGYWVDNDLTLEDYRSFNPVSVSAKEFEALWGKPFIV